MGFSCGIVGLPNAGKSTLFNALLSRIQALTAPYPFSTVEPHRAKIPVPDPRLPLIAEISRSEKTTPPFLEVVDIAGLVRNAHQGEGLGNQFLSQIQEVDLILHVIRCFENPDIPHLEGKVDPVRDGELIEIELVLTDLSSLEKKREKIARKAKGDPSLKEEEEKMSHLIELLKKGIPLRKIQDPSLLLYARSLNTLTSKPVLVVGNLREGDERYLEPLKELAERWEVPWVSLYGKLEEEIGTLPPEEQETFRKEMGGGALSVLIKKGYSLLHLITFFTTNEKETRATPVPEGTTAYEGAGKIHTDMQKGFIRAEVVPAEIFIQLRGWQECRNQGKTRWEGKEYPIQDGDLIHFRFQV